MDTKFQLNIENEQVGAQIDRLNWAIQNLMQNSSLDSSYREPNTRFSLEKIDDEMSETISVQDDLVLDKLEWLHHSLQQERMKLEDYRSNELRNNSFSHFQPLQFTQTNLFQTKTVVKLSKKDLLNLIQSVLMIVQQSEICDTGWISLGDWKIGVKINKEEEEVSSKQKLIQNLNLKNEKVQIREACEDELSIYTRNLQALLIQSYIDWQKYPQIIEQEISQIPADLCLTRSSVLLQMELNQLHKNKEYLDKLKSELQWEKTQISLIKQEFNKKKNVLEAEKQTMARISQQVKQSNIQLVKDKEQLEEEYQMLEGVKKEFQSYHRETTKKIQLVRQRLADYQIELFSNSLNRTANSRQQQINSDPKRSLNSSFEVSLPYNQQICNQPPLIRQKTRKKSMIPKPKGASISKTPKRRNFNKKGLKLDLGTINREEIQQPPKTEKHSDKTFVFNGDQMIFYKEIYIIKTRLTERQQILQQKEKYLANLIFQLQQQEETSDLIQEYQEELSKTQQRLERDQNDIDKQRLALSKKTVWINKKQSELIQRESQVQEDMKQIQEKRSLLQGNISALLNSLDDYC